MPRVFRRSSSRHLRFVSLLGLLALPACSLNVEQQGLSVLVIVSGDQQNVQPGGVALPLTVRAYTGEAHSIPDLQVKWNIASGGGSLSATTTTTDDTGATTVVYTAGNTIGTSIITASAEGISVTFHVNVVAASG